MQQAGDYQVALLYLLGLDWQIASEWQKVRDREKTLTELKKAAGAGAFGSIIGKASDLRTQVTVAEARLKEMQTQLADFRVLPQYAEMESEADQLTRQINDLANANVIDAGIHPGLGNRDAVRSPATDRRTGEHLCRGWRLLARTRHQALRRSAVFPRIRHPQPPRLPRRRTRAAKTARRRKGAGKAASRRTPCRSDESPEEPWRP